MGTVKFSALNELTTLGGNDVVCAVDVSEGGAEQSKKVKFSTMRDYFIMTTLPGYMQRPHFQYHDADQILIYSGIYNCGSKYSYWSPSTPSYVNMTLSGAGAYEIHYLYLDYSAITSGTELTNSEFLFSTTAPSWNSSSHGYYNGSDRCIFAVVTDGSGNIREFLHNGDTVFYADGIADRVAASITQDTWTDVTLKIPGFSRRAIVTAQYYWGSYGNWGTLSWRTNGQSGTTGHRALQVEAYAYSRYANGTFSIITDSSQIVEFKSTSASSFLGVTTQGWHLPEGM